MRAKLRGRFSSFVRRGLFPVIFLFLGASFVNADECPPSPAPGSALPLSRDLIASVTQDFEKSAFLDPVALAHADLRKVAELLIDRLYKICDSHRSALRLDPEDASTDLMMLVPERALGGIARYGFKNQHQVPAGSATESRESRVAKESDFLVMGIPYTTAGRELLPKYALQVFNDPRAHGKFRLPEEYGSVVVKFKQSVKKRATWSPQDSLSMNEADLPLRTNLIPARADIHCEQNAAGFTSYCESQIWGPLDRSDVAALYVKEGTAISDEMRAMGVPIYTYRNRYPRVESYRWEGGRAVLPPDSADPDDKTSLRGVTLSTAPVETPASGRAPAPDPSLDRSSFVAEMKARESYREKSDDELVKLAGEPLVLPADGWGRDSKLKLTTPKEYALAELAARPLGEKAKAVFLSEFRNSKDSAVRRLALGGLAGLPWEELKPILKDALNDDSVNNRALAAMIAFRHLPDPGLSIHTDTPLVQRLTEGKLCPADP